MQTHSAAVTRLDCCQYLLSSQINYTLTHVAEHSAQFSHDIINRSVAGEQITPRLVWDNLRGQVVLTPDGYRVFDATVADKHYARHMGLVRRPWSGNAHAVINGIGMVSGVYVHPRTAQFWIIDDRRYDPAGDGQSKLDHVHDMLMNVVQQQRLPLRAVLTVRPA